jgi:hypothetical protein
MKKVLMSILVIGMILLLPVTAFARAGGSTGGGGGHSGGGTGGGTGGGSRGGGTFRTYTGGGGYGGYGGYGRGGSVAGMVVSGVVVAGAFGANKIRKKRLENQRRKDDVEEVKGELMRENLTAVEVDELLQTINDIFLHVQDAWNARDLKVAQNVMTDNLQTFLQKDLDELEENHQRNFTTDIEVLSISNFMDVDREPTDLTSFRVNIEFSCLDYTLDDYTGRVVEGSQKRKGTYVQTWYFNKIDWSGDWQADYIQEIVTEDGE